MVMRLMVMWSLRPGGDVRGSFEDVLYGQGESGNLSKHALWFDVDDSYG